MLRKILKQVAPRPKPLLREGVSIKPGSAPKLANIGNLNAGDLVGDIVDALPLDEIAAAIKGIKFADAVRYGHGMWKLQAKFKDVRVNAVSAFGGPGCLDGPDLGPLIEMYPGAQGLSKLEYRVFDAMVEGVSDCFADWQDGVTVPGLPWYPAFAAYPGPMAAPTPNIPTPLIACVSTGMNRLTSTEIAKAIKSELPATWCVGPVKDAIDVLAAVLGAYFMTWVASQMVMLVLGKGPVPSFAPPYVPVGPVVGGDIISTPGHLMS